MSSKMISKDGHGHLVMTSQEERGLWQLNIKTLPSRSSTHMVVSASCGPSIGGHTQVTKALKQWHAKLGHFNFQTLKEMNVLETVHGLRSFKKVDFHVHTVHTFMGRN